MDKTISFFKWLMTRKDEDSPVGDLVQDILVDECFPRKATIPEMRNHLEYHHACEDALNAFDEAWADYVDTLGGMNDTTITEVNQER